VKIRSSSSSSSSSSSRYGCLQEGGHEIL